MPSMLTNQRACKEFVNKKLPALPHILNKKNILQNNDHDLRLGIGYYLLHKIYWKRDVCLLNLDR